MNLIQMWLMKGFTPWKTSWIKNFEQWKEL
jgi:hypothetical protein